MHSLVRAHKAWQSETLPTFSDRSFISLAVLPWQIFLGCSNLKVGIMKVFVLVLVVVVDVLVVRAVE